MISSLGDFLEISVALAVEEHFITPQSLLECRTHEAITGTRLWQELEVEPEEREVDNDGHND